MRAQDGGIDDGGDGARVMYGRGWKAKDVVVGIGEEDQQVCREGGAARRRVVTSPVASAW